MSRGKYAEEGISNEWNEPVNARGGDHPRVSELSIPNNSKDVDGLHKCYKRTEESNERHALLLLQTPPCHVSTWSVPFMQKHHQIPAFKCQVCSCMNINHLIMEWPTNGSRCEKEPAKPLASQEPPLNAWAKELPYEVNLKECISHMQPDLLPGRKHPRGLTQPSWAVSDSSCCISTGTGGVKCMRDGSSSFLLPVAAPRMVFPDLQPGQLF